MANHSCAHCGTPLEHISEACPNCLPKMAERPLGENKAEGASGTRSIRLKEEAKHMNIWEFLDKNAALLMGLGIFGLYVLVVILTHGC